MSLQLGASCFLILTVIPKSPLLPIPLSTLLCPSKSGKEYWLIKTLFPSLQLQFQELEVLLKHLQLLPRHSSQEQRSPTREPQLPPNLLFNQHTLLPPLQSPFLRVPSSSHRQSSQSQTHQRTSPIHPRSSSPLPSLRSR